MSIAENIRYIREQINQIQGTDAVSLLAVSKTFGVQAVQEAIEAGQSAFGENYVQEGVQKIRYFEQAFPNVLLQWHFIGPLQSNKTREVAQYFDWVESIDREKIVRRLSEQRGAEKEALKLLIEVNIDQQNSKSGVKAEAVRDLADLIMTLPNLSLQGLMCIPDPNRTEKERLNSLKRMRALFDQLKSEGYPMNVLSMGMSSDMIDAIHCGSTQVRIGSAIFGERHYE